MADAALLDDLVRRLTLAVKQRDLSGRCLAFAIEGVGSIVIDGRQEPVALFVDEDRGAECTLSMSSETARRLMRHEIDPTRAFMEGRLTFTGSIPAAMKMAPILRKAAEV